MLRSNLVMITAPYGPFSFVLNVRSAALLFSGWGLVTASPY